MNITPVITSYNRWNFLEKCVNSFFKLTNNKLKPIIIEDSTNQQIKNKIINTWGDTVELIFNEINIGQTRSIDKAYSQVNTEYILKIEDDYEFSGNANFIDDAISILEDRNDIHQIWIRHINNFKVSHGKDAPEKLFDQEILKTKNNVEYRMVKVRGPWCGKSFMPSIVRTNDYKTMFPNGYIEICKDQKPGVLQEVALSKFVLQFNYRAALLNSGACATKHSQSTYGK